MRFKNAVLAGLIFGLLMGVPILFTFAWQEALYMGAINMFLFGGAMYWYSNSAMLKRQVAIDTKDLLEGENILFEEMANLVVKPKDFGLQKFAFDDLLWLVGMKDKETLGGRFYLTNYRLIFKTSRFNRLRGTISVFLPTIQRQTDKSFFLLKKLLIETELSKIELVIESPETVIQKIEAAKQLCGAEELEKIQHLAIENPQKVSDSLAAWEALNVVNNLFLLSAGANKAGELIKKPMEALGAIFYKELVDKKIEDSWQKRIDK